MIQTEMGIKPMLVVFIAQPTSGTEEEVKQKRYEISIRLKATYKDNTIVVVNSYFCKGNRNYELSDVGKLGESIKMLSPVDLVVFASGWKNSTTCRILHMVCNNYKIKTIFESQLILI